MPRIILSLLFFLLFFIPSSIGQDFLHWMHGHWQGTGYQVPTDTSWPIDLMYDPGTQSITISYPSLNCSGHWKFVKLSARRAEFVELIDEGRENCDNAVRVIVTYVDDEYISVTYFLPKFYDGVVAHSVLRRQDKS